MYVNLFALLGCKLLSLMKENQPTDEADDAIVNALRSCGQELRKRGYSTSGWLP